MIDIDTTKLESLLEAKKFDEAKKLLEEYFKSHLTGEEKASLYLDFAGTYLSVMNKINGRYNAAMRSVLEDLEKVDSAEKDAKHRLKLVEVRSSL